MWTIVDGVFEVQLALSAILESLIKVLSVADDKGVIGVVIGVVVAALSFDLFLGGKLLGASCSEAVDLLLAGVKLLLQLFDDDLEMLRASLDVHLYFVFNEFGALCEA